MSHRKRKKRPRRQPGEPRPIAIAGCPRVGGAKQVHPRAIIVNCRRCERPVWFDPARARVAELTNAHRVCLCPPCLAALPEDLERLKRRPSTP